MMRTLVLLLAAALLVPQGVPVTKPQFVDGLAQPVFAGSARHPPQRLGRGPEPRYAIATA